MRSEGAVAGMVDQRNELEVHCGIAAREIRAGRVVPFLGAGANLCGRPEELTWRPGQFDWLPNGNELAGYLAGLFDYAEQDRQDLVRVSQYVSLMVGAYPLYEELRRLFDGDYPPTKLHEFLAEIPAMLRAEQPDRVPYQLIVTTNYDDLLERAFAKQGEPYDLVTYNAVGQFGGKFTHYPSGGEPKVILEPNAYSGVSTSQRTVILKIHGAIDRNDASRDSYVITEDHYIDYLARTGHPGRQAAPQPLPVPRLQPAGLAPAGDPQPDLGRRAPALQVLGDPAPARPARCAPVGRQGRRDLAHPARGIHRKAARCAGIAAGRWPDASDGGR